MIVYTTTRYKRRGKKNPPAAGKTKIPSFVPKRPMHVDVFGPPTDCYRSKIDDFLSTVDPSTTGQHAPRYEGELAEREAVARQHAAALKRCVAPAFNKGAYTLITSPEQAKWIGRK